MLEPGNLVRLKPRERPHHDDPNWWWEVVAVTETGFDAIVWSAGTAIARRRDVAFIDVWPSDR